MTLRFPFILAACLLAGSSRQPQVGDVYASYYERRQDKYGLDNGFRAQSIFLSVVTAKSNGTLYQAVLSFPFTNTGQYPFLYNYSGPLSNFGKRRDHQTLLIPYRPK